MSELPDQDPKRGDPGATRARTGGQPNESIQPANARGRVVVDGSASPSTPDAEKKARYIEQARRERAEMGFFGHIDAGMRAAANTATFGYADTIAAGGDALFGSGEGATIAERYRDNVMRQEAITQADSEVHSGATQTGEFAASMLPYERGLRFLKGGERILRRLTRRGKGKACRQCSRKPVALADGVKVTHDVDFELPGLPLITLSRVYASDLDIHGPLGRNRISVFDEAIVGQEDGSLLYLMGSGLEAEFTRPAPNPGAVSRNARHPYLALSAAGEGELEIRRYGVVSRFARFAGNVWLLVGFSDPNGNGVTLARDAAGLLTRADRTDGFALAFENDARGLRIAVTLHAPSGETRLISRFAYDDRENLVEARNSYRPSLRYEYDAQNRFTAYEDGVKVRNEYAYDAEGRVVRVSTPGGRFDYTVAYRLEARETTLTYVAPEGGAATTYVFDDNGRPLCEIDPLGHITTYERDEFGELLSEIDPEGNRTSYGYDAFGARAFVEDAEGRRTSFHHDADGRLERQIDAAGATWEWGYDERGALVWARDPLGHRTDFVNDAAGLPTGTMRHDGLIEKRDYDAQHRLVRLVDFRGGVTRFDRDAFGRVVAVTDPMGGVTRFAYEEKPGADFWTASAYVRADGVVLTRDVEPSRATITMADGERRRATYRFGPYDLVEEIEDVHGARIRFAYDHEERLVRVENQLGRVWTFERDAAGRVTQETDFDDLRIDYVYDRADRVTERRYADGARSLLAYDKSALLLREDVFEPGAVEPEVTRYRYDARGLLAEAENHTARIAFERDELGRVTAELADERRIANAYDCCGNRIERRIGDRLATSIYDPLGAATKITIGEHAPLSFRRDKIGREVGRTSAEGFAVEQRWDAVGRLIHQRSGSVAADRPGLPSPGGEQVTLERAYQWNRSLEPVAVTDRMWGETVYTYQDNGQITQAVHGDEQPERFSYDPNRSVVASVVAATGLAEWERKPGGRIAVAYGPLGERLSLTHDSRRRVVERRVERNGFRPSVWRYRWNARDQMVECETPSGERWSYAYDPFGRRIRKERLLTEREQAWVRTRHPKLVPAAFGRGAGDIWPERPPGVSEIDQESPIVGAAFLWDGDVVAEEAPLRLDGSVDWKDATRWHYEPGSFRPLAKEQPNGRLLYIVNDALGTPRELLSETGQVVWAGEQWLWGGLRRVWAAENDNARRGAANPGGWSGRTWGALALKDDPEALDVAAVCPIRFQGQWEDQETGLFYNRYRHYDAALAQYVSPDPIGVVGGVQSYAYVSNPAFEIDPFGLSGGSTTLRRNLEKGGCVPAGVGGVPWQAQHNIPQEVWGANQKFFDDIGMGADPKTGNPRDSASNGTALPRDETDGKKLGMCCHRGSHPQYTDRVRSRVEQVRDAFNQGKLTPEQARSQIGNLQQSLGQEMANMPPGCRIS